VEDTTMSRQEDPVPEGERVGHEGDDAEVSEPVTPPIDEDVAGSVNAALHDTDE